MVSPLSCCYQPCQKVCPHLSSRPPVRTEGAQDNKIPAELSLLQADQHQLSHPSLTGEVIHSPDHLCVLLSLVHILLMSQSSIQCSPCPSWNAGSKHRTQNIPAHKGVHSTKIILACMQQLSWWFPTSCQGVFGCHCSKYKRAVNI